MRWNLRWPGSPPSRRTRVVIWEMIVGGAVVAYVVGERLTRRVDPQTGKVTHVYLPDPDWDARRAQMLEGGRIAKLAARFVRDQSAETMQWIGRSQAPDPDVPHDEQRPGAGPDRFLVILGGRRSAAIQRRFLEYDLKRRLRRLFRRPVVMEERLPPPKRPEGGKDGAE